MTDQQQFLDVIDRDEAERRFRDQLELRPLGSETVELSAALGRVLAEDVRARIDVPSFDRSNYDGFAVRAEDTFGTDEEHPRRLQLLPEVLQTAVVPSVQVNPGEAVTIATGAMVPRGADAVVMVEHVDVEGEDVLVRRSVTPGFGVAFAGTDISTGETVLRAGEQLTSRETGVLAALGVSTVEVWKRPVVGIISTGDEIIEPGQPMLPGRVFDSNARIIADAVAELGADPRNLGIVSDDFGQLRSVLEEGLADCDIVLLSGGTSKGAGDISYQVVRERDDPGIVAHGVALKPGKPICLAVAAGKPVVILPGFPTSAIFTFHEFVAPVIRVFGGRAPDVRQGVSASMAVKVNSELGRTEYLLVGLVSGADSETSAFPDGRDTDLVAYPMGKGSGSVTTFSRADGFVTIGRHHEILEAGERVDVQLLGRDLKVADLVVIGSHCVGLDYLLGQLQRRGFHTKFLAVGSTAGLDSVRRRECDLAGIHLLDPDSNRYNRPFLSEEMELVTGYGRLQGVVHRVDDDRFLGLNAEAAIARAAEDSGCLMVNRNQGSGTRILIDQLLGGRRPAGYAVQSKSHHAVAAAVRQNRADWGVAIETVARAAGLGFLPLTEERFDFAIPRERLSRPAVQAFCDLLQ